MLALTGLTSTGFSFKQCSFKGKTIRRRQEKDIDKEKIRLCVSNIIARVSVCVRMGESPYAQDATDDAEHPVEVFESGAILQYLADRYGGLDTPASRAAAGMWVVWANASLDPCLFIENERGQVLDSGVRWGAGAAHTVTVTAASISLSNHRRY